MVSCFLFSVFFTCVCAGVDGGDAKEDEEMELVESTFENELLTTNVGELLAVAWNDGVVRIIGLEGGKPINRIRISEGGNSSKISFMAWTRNISRTTSSSSSKGGLGERRLMLDGDGPGKKAPDLPRELVYLEIDTALPKLPPLISSGMTG